MKLLTKIELPIEFAIPKFLGKYHVQISNTDINTININIRQIWIYYE